MQISASNKQSKTHHTKMGHRIVFTGAVLLTIASIAGSVALADLVPMEEIKDLDQMVKSALGQDNRESSRPSEQRMSNENETVPSKDFKSIGFKSLVSPKLLSCFNCGEIIAIESMPYNAYELSNSPNLVMDQFGDYLDAHRDITRMVSPADDRERVLATNGADQKIKNTYLIKVRMQNGTEHTLTQYSPPQKDVGDTIRVITDKTITA